MRRRDRFACSLALVWALAPGCSRDEGRGLAGRGATQASTPSRADPAAPVTLEELDRLLAGATVPGVAADGLKLEEALSLRVTGEGGAELESLDESTQLEVDAAGRWRGSNRNSRGYARELAYVDGALYARAGFGRWVRRRPEMDEPRQLREELTSGLGATWELVGPAARISGEAGIQRGARAARRVTLALAPAPRRPARPTTDPDRAWRASVRVTALTGTLVLDARDGTVLEAELDARYGFRRSTDGGVAPLEAAVKLHRQTEPAGSLALDAPEDALAPPRRPRPQLDRRELLEGLSGVRRR